MVSVTKRLILKILVVSSIWVSSAIADVVQLEDGTIIHGQLSGASAGQYQIETEFGALNIGQEKIKSLRTDNYVYVALKSGSNLKGKLVYKNQRTQIKTGTEVLDISHDLPIALWREGQQNPLLPTIQGRNWKYEASLDIAGKTGNAEQIGTAGSLSAILDTDKDRLQFYIHGERTKTEGERSAEELVAGVDYENRFKPPHSWYTRVELERDLVENIDLRATAAVGYGYYFIKEDWHELRGRIGLQLRHEVFDEGVIEEEEERIRMDLGLAPTADVDVDDNETTLAADLGLFYRYDINEWGRWITDITVFPSLENIDNFRGLHESSLEVPLANSQIWKLRVGVGNEYNSQPPGDTKRLDTTYFARLVLAWE